LEYRKLLQGIGIDRIAVDNCGDFVTLEVERANADK